MGFNRELRRLMLLFMAAFTIIALAAAYWAVVEREDMLARADNPRQIEALASIRRGTLYDSAETPLVISEVNGRTVTRRYLHPETYSALGYYSLRYGASRLEDDYNTVLNGEDHPITIEDALLQRPRQGSDVLLTLNLELQRAAAQALEGQRGAVVLLHVPTGNVLASVSLPTFDPNTLDNDWDALRDDVNSPLFNRALQGRYQPGGAMQTAVLAALTLQGHPLDTMYPQAAAPVMLDDLTLTCAHPPPSTDLTLMDAYTYACPGPFAQLASTLPPEVVERAQHMLDEAARAATAESLSTAPAPPAQDPLEALLGQGRVTVSPMGMALLTAAVVNEGNAPPPRTLAATRGPGAADWTPASRIEASIPLMTATVGDQLADYMAAALERYGHEDGMGGHAARAYTGETTLVWFIGYAAITNGEHIVIALVLEDESDAERAAQLGINLLLTGRSVMTTPAVQSTGTP